MTNHTGKLLKWWKETNDAAWKLPFPDWNGIDVYTKWMVGSWVVLLGVPILSVIDLAMFLRHCSQITAEELAYQRRQVELEIEKNQHFTEKLRLDVEKARIELEKKRNAPKHKTRLERAEDAYKKMEEDTQLAMSLPEGPIRECAIKHAENTYTDAVARIMEER